MLFLTALSSVSTMLLYACPGFILVKAKLIKGESISAFARVLMCVCSPCLIYSSITRNTFSKELGINMLIALGIMTSLLLLGIFGFYFIFRKKRDDVRYRIYALATTLANGAFMGVPVLEALFPDYPDALAFSAMFSLALNVIGWSVGSYIISGDKKYVSIRKILLNPATVAIAVAIPFFIFNISLPTLINDMVSLLAKMSTPLCMLIVGMRLATASLKSVFLTPMQYLIVGIKQLLFPFIVLLILLPLPIDTGLKSAVYIILACPVASVILGFSEMIGSGQKTAANLVLLGTLLSAITIPIMSLLICLF